MRHIFQFTISKADWKYLGVKVFAQQRTSQSANEIIDGVSHRIQGWKGQCLTMAGWHLLHAAQLNETVLLTLEKMIHSFLWGGGVKERVIHLLHWEAFAAGASRRSFWMAFGVHLSGWRLK
ncbi:hypothetical protein QJS10_CPA07g00873 [Acorus calamus]|uniref:Uncharacterized protein n=1 Tax=Acorus calamus TaxID=4465 RepID=A0AAV9EF83_ACOCL|nr:hypothetical protein QJS10_CPA07g00873 [Acorus calamus]